MIVFVGAAFFLLAAAVVILLWPLVKSTNTRVVGRHLSNLDIHRDQFSELEKDLEAGTLAADRYEQAKNELEKRVLEEAQAPVDPPQSTIPDRAVPVVIGVFIPLTAILLYLYL